MKFFLMCISLALLITHPVSSLATDTTLILTKFDLKDGNKDFSIKHDATQNLYTMKMTLAWQNFNSKLNSIGYQLTDSATARFISPELPTGCALNDTGLPILGFMDGLDGGGNLFVFVIKGEACAQFVQQLTQTAPLEIEFTEVPSLSSPTVITPVVRLKVLDLPNQGL